MYAVTPKGAELIKVLNRHLDRGLLSHGEWAREIHDVAQYHWAFGERSCGMKGCNFPSMWRALSPVSTATSRHWVRMCAGCVEWHTDALCLEPIHREGIYSPDAGKAIESNNSKMGGFWAVYRNGSLYDSMVGYGYPWAMATLKWLCAPEWVESGHVEFTNRDTGYNTTVHAYRG